MRKERIVFAAFAAVVLVLVLLTGCKKKGSPDDFVLRIGYAGSLCEAPIHIAQELSYFTGEGLNVELIKIDSATAYNAITTGQIDACFALLAAIITPLSNGLPAKITTGLHTGCDIVLVKPNSGITKPTDLRGKKIGIPNMTSSPAIYTKRVLADNNVDIRAETSEVEFVIYSVSDLPIVLENGSVDAIAMNEPTATIAANAYGFQVLLDSAADEPYKDQYCCVGYVSTRLAEKNNDIAEKYTRAIQKASAYVQANQEETAHIQIEKKYVAGNPAVNGEVLKKFLYTPSVSGAYDAFLITAKQLQQIGMLSPDINVEALHKNSFTFFKGLDPQYNLQAKK